MSAPTPCVRFDGRVEEAIALSTSRQVIPTALGRLMSDPDPEGAGRVREAMLAMSRIDVVGLEAAHAGP
ncbi:MAG TPA: hypothetical protein VMI11_09280 [Actinomycetes bacterium]|nr:hypothetical protein [Actinomycetes bacterium]